MFAYAEVRNVLEFQQVVRHKRKPKFFYFGCCAPKTF